MSEDWRVFGWEPYPKEQIPLPKYIELKAKGHAKLEGNEILVAYLVNWDDGRVKNAFDEEQKPFGWKWEQVRETVAKYVK